MLLHAKPLLTIGGSRPSLRIHPSAVKFDGLGHPQRVQDPSGKWLKTEFGARGQALRLCESSAVDATPGCAPGVATTYVENQEADAFGNTVREMRGGSTAMQTFRQGRKAYTCRVHKRSAMHHSRGFGGCDAPLRMTPSAYTPLG